ncbi:MAG: orotidine-5'-phosphate decarboxylase [Acidobacteriota bacterium]|nr:orotidine-5'-phosphate decarboxylase [Acidobacteriota bacterium]
MTMSPAGSGPATPSHPGWVAEPGAGELVVAVDTPSLDEALRLRDTLAGAVSFYKVGKELFTAAGPRAVSEFASVGRVFLDLKFHDIPATVAGAVRASASLGASILDVHASGGRPMLEAAARAASDAPAPPLLLGVTVLTHLDQESAAEVYPGASIPDQVLNLARLARGSGLGGVVASAAEAEALRRAFGDAFVLLVPGVRPRWAAETHDQKRVATPGEAARRGANYIVVGRAITRHADPRAAALRILEETGG